MLRSIYEASMLVYVFKVNVDHMLWKLIQARCSNDDGRSVRMLSTCFLDTVNGL